MKRDMVNYEVQCSNPLFLLFFFIIAISLCLQSCASMSNQSQLSLNNCTYIPPDAKLYKKNENGINKIIDEPYDMAWVLATKAASHDVDDNMNVWLSPNAQVNNNINQIKNSGIIQIKLKGDYSNYTHPVDCGWRGYTGIYNAYKNYIYPEFLVLDIKLRRINESKTSIQVKLHEIWKSAQSKYKCVSIGDLENIYIDELNEQETNLKNKIKRQEQLRVEKKKEEQRKEEEKKMKAEQLQKEKAEREAERKEEQEEKAERREWKKAGFSSSQVTKWESGYFNAEEAIFLRHKCPAGAGTMNEILTGNPYDFKNKCFTLISSRNIQLLNRTTALFGNIKVFALINFGHDSAPSFIYGDKYALKGTGVFKYTAVDGSLQIVPSFKAIRIPEKYRTNNK